VGFGLDITHAHLIERFKMCLYLNDNLLILSTIKIIRSFVEKYKNSRNGINK
jgi:hypothetical protein